MFILVATINLCIQYSNAVSKKSESDSEDIFDTSNIERESQESLKNKSQEASITGDTDEPNESAAATTSEDTYNNISSTPSAESIIMTTSDLTSTNQTSNLTEVEPKATLTIQEKLSKGIIPDITIINPLSTYKVKVVFDSITVHDDHEGLIQVMANMIWMHLYKV